MGFTEEAGAFAGWLRDRVQEKAGGASGPLNIMYRVDGSSDLAEETLGHWEGYRGSRPVHIGNCASGQLQLDIYGEALDSLYFADQRGLTVGHQGWLEVRDILDWLTDNWDQPEEGIWETRGGRKNFTYGRVMSWTAFDRAIRLAATRDVRVPSTSGPAPGRDLRPGDGSAWNEERGAFVQEYDEVLDSSLLRMPTVGFIAPQDPMWLSTLKAMDTELVSDSLVYRYDPAASPDGLRGSEGPSRCALSCTSTRSGRPAGSTRRGSPSRRCSPTPTTSACTPRRSRSPGSDRQLPPGVHAPRPDRRRHDPGRATVPPAMTAPPTGRSSAVGEVAPPLARRLAHYKGADMSDEQDPQRPTRA